MKASGRTNQVPEQTDVTASRRDHCEKIVKALQVKENYRKEATRAVTRLLRRHLERKPSGDSKDLAAIGTIVFLCTLSSMIKLQYQYQVIVVLIIVI